MIKVGIRAAIVGAVSAVFILLVRSEMTEHKLMKMETPTSNYEVYLKDEELRVKPMVIKTVIGDLDYYLDMSEEEKEIYTIDNYNNFTYMTSLSEDDTVLDEMLITDNLPEEVKKLGMYKSYMEKLLMGSKPKALEEEEAIRGLLEVDDCYIYTSTTSSSKEKLGTLEETTTYIKEIGTNLKKYYHSDDTDIEISLNGIGKVRLNDLSVLKGHAGLYYGADNILRLYNYSEDVAYVFITNINNRLLMNTVSTLETTEYNNVYADKDHKVKDRMGYRTYSIMTSEGMYTIRINENAKEELEEEVFKWLGINKEDTKIELPFSLVK